MANKQLIAPNLSTTDLPGWCLRFVGNAYNIKNRPHDRARKAWAAAVHKHSPSEPLPTDVPVIIHYNWWGTIDGEYDNWGDIAISIPGKGIFGTPKSGSGKGNRFDGSVEARRSWLGGKNPNGTARPAEYIGWSEDVNGVRVSEIVKSNEPAPQPGSQTYTVQRGDTLSGIAARYGTTWQNLAAINGIADANKIYAGQVIKVTGSAPAQPTYTVKKGDTLSGIAGNNGTTWQELQRINGISNPNLIHPGQVIKLR